MEQIKETENQDNQLVEVGKVFYESRGYYGSSSYSGTIYIKNTFGILSVLVKTEEGVFYLVIPEKTERVGGSNAYFEINRSKCFLTLPDSLITVLQKGSLS